MASSGKPAKVLAFALVGVVVGVSAYMVLSTPDYVYSMGVEQLSRQTERWVDRQLRVTGELVPGTLKKRAAGCGFDFQLRERGRNVSVHYDGCVMPDTVCDLPPSEPPSTDEFSQQITVGGQLARPGSGFHFEASEIMARCSASYWLIPDGGDARVAMCARHRPDFYCPMCQGASAAAHGHEPEPRLAPRSTTP